jgi:acyl-coenzyme A thioesterase PaaI-like protein
LAPDYAALTGIDAANGCARLTLDGRHAGTPPVAHGGLILSLAEAALASLGAGAVTSLQAQLVAAARRGETLAARATLVRTTRTLAFAAVEVCVDDRLIARASAVLTPE